MKRILLFLMLAGLVANGQRISEIDSITFESMRELVNSPDHKNRVSVQHYKTRSGSWLKVGDTLEIGFPSNPNNVEQGYAGKYSTHSHIFLGTGASAMAGTFMMGNEAMAGDRAFITEIEMARVSKKQDFDVLVYLNKVGGGRFVNLKKLARAMIDDALETGEVIDPNAPMTREEAIAKLKEAKELVDLGLKTQEEFEALREKLSPIILDGN